jgi:P-type Ca2+ transporter type 2C
VAVQFDGIPAYQQAFERVVAALQSDAHQGLSPAEAQVRLEQHGRNELATDPPAPAWRRFLAQFEDALVILLFAATAISAGLWLYEGDSALPYEAIAISAVVLLNAVMGYLQESRAESAVSALRQMAATQARVIRGGQPRRIDASAIVPGDIILIEEGDTIPADGRVIASTALQTIEAALTGESVPTAKDVVAIAEEMSLGEQSNMVSAGPRQRTAAGRRSS